MEASIVRNDLLQVELTLTPSEASAICTLLDCGYDWSILGHDWNPLITILSSFTDEHVLKRVGKSFPFTKDGSHEQPAATCQPIATGPTELPQ